MGHDRETGSGRLDVVVVAHPADVAVRQAFKQRAGGVQRNQRLSIFPLRGLADFTAQIVHHELAAVADAQDRHTPGINFRIDGRRIGQISAVRATGKNDTLGIFGLDLGKVRAVRIDLTIHVAFTDAACNQLIILAAKVQNNDSFLLHGDTPFLICTFHTIDCHIIIACLLPVSNKLCKLFAVRKCTAAI